MNGVSCVPFWNPERQTTSSACLRVAGISVNITLIVIAILSLCNVSPLNQLSMPGPWVMLAGGGASLLLFGSIKCIIKKIIQSETSQVAQPPHPSERTTPGPYTQLSISLSNAMADFERGKSIQARKVLIDIVNKATREIVFSQDFPLSDSMPLSETTPLTREEWVVMFWGGSMDIPREYLTPQMEIAFGLLIKDTSGKIEFLHLHLDAETLFSNVLYEQVLLKDTSLNHVQEYLKVYNPSREVPEI